MTTTKTSKISLNIFDDKRFYVNNIKNYPHDKELYLFKRDLLNMIKKLYEYKDLPSSFTNKDKDKDVDKLINDIKELTIDSNKKLIEAAIICEAVGVPRTSSLSLIITSYFNYNYRSNSYLV